MGRELVTACMFCLLCATHAHCSSHHDVEDSQLLEPSISDGDGGGGGLILPFQSNAKRRIERDTNERSKTQGDGDVDYLTVVFEKFGDGNSLNREGFEKLLDVLGLSISVKESTAQKDGLTLLGNNSVDLKNSTPKVVHCENILSISTGGINKSEYKDLCPKLLYHLVPENEGGCVKSLVHSSSHTHEEYNDVEAASTAAAWVYASISVVLISLCGLLAVAVIPLMQMSLYQGLLQFLVALAVGTLCGDALLHLLPHAMMSTHTHHHSHSDEEAKIDQHEVNLWRGLVAVLSIVFFYFMEKCLSLITEFKKKYQRKTKTNTRVRVMREEHSGNEESRVGEKLCKHKYSSYPYCYGEIANSTDAHQMSGESEINNISKIREENGTGKTLEPEADPQKEEVPSSEKQLLETSSEIQNEYTTIILREHETRHHGHAHTHGHVHSAPGSLGSVAWMVVMGDGIHNLTDGLAIGAAFAANIGGGVSTAVAVFCHELPHEIGDFAVLLKAGMSAKQAVFYNVLSSLLCLIGMSIGVVLGHNDHVKLWVFSAAAGMFLYIALVDMIPELSSTHSKEGGSICQCLLQVFGFLTGIGIMLLIALYEHDLMTSFQNKF